MTIKEIEQLSHSHPILVYDGICVLCNRFIQFLDRRDKQNIFRYATLQGKDGLAIQVKAKHPDEMETVILVHKGEYKTHSSVGLYIFYLLGFPYNLVYPLILIPPFIRDWVYQKIANNRYAWFGKTDTCLLPDTSRREKLLS